VSVALCTCWQSAKQATSSAVINQPRREGVCFNGFLRFASSDGTVWRMIVFIVLILASFSVSGNTKLRTNPVAQYRGFLLSRANMYSVSHSDQRAVRAFAALKLTPRETEVLFWISQGKSNHDIGVILGAKTGTICKHVEHILGKLNVENRTAAAVVALETSRSAAPASESNPGQPWATIAGFVTTQLYALCSDGSDLFSEFASALLA
jgi:DNA-binding CsgD family transcriptional regulator